MIIEMSSKFDGELTQFLKECNGHNAYFIAWIPTDEASLRKLDKRSFFLCIEEGRIVGALGAAVFREQKVVRLLGPIIEQDYFDAYVDELFDRCLSNLPEDTAEIKIAFLEENTLCRLWCARKHFELYNSEITMVSSKTQWNERIVPPGVLLTPYEAKYHDGLEQVHPKGSYFTLNELIDGIGSLRKLILAVADGEVVGYVCFERTSEGKEGEMLLLHVRPDRRGHGYGSLLMNEALVQLKDAQVEAISLSVRTDNLQAQRLYRRMGFEKKRTIYAYRKQL